MFDPYFIHGLEYGVWDMCCIQMSYLPYVELGADGISKTTPIDIYVRGYVVNAGYAVNAYEECYITAICDKTLDFSKKYYVRIFNKKSLPSLYKMPLLWALTSNIITFDNGRVNFVLNQDKRPMKVTDIFKEEDCIDNLAFREICKKYKCKCS